MEQVFLLRRPASVVERQQKLKRRRNDGHFDLDSICKSRQTHKFYAVPTSSLSGTSAASLISFRTRDKYSSRRNNIRIIYVIYSLLFNPSHGILIQEIWNFPPNPFIPAWSLSKSLPCLLLNPGLKPFLITSKQ